MNGRVKEERHPEHACSLKKELAFSDSSNFLQFTLKGLEKTESDSP